MGEKISGVLKLCKVSFCMFLRMLYINVMLAPVFTFQGIANVDFE